MPDLTFTITGEKIVLTSVGGARLSQQADGSYLFEEGLPERRTARLVLLIGQSLTLGRAPAVTVSPPANLKMFNGGFEHPNVADPAFSFSDQAFPPPAHNFTSLVPFVGLAGKEGWAPGWAAQDSSDLVVVYSAGGGSQSARQLRPGRNYFSGFRWAAQRFVALAEAAGYDPEIVVVIDHGHANTDLFTDGNNTGETATTTPQYLEAIQKWQAAVVATLTGALRARWNGQILLVPLLTANSGGTVYTPAGIRAVVEAQRQAGALPGFRLVPPRSQWCSLFDTDLVHPVGQGYRYFAETVSAFNGRPDLVAPQMVSVTDNGAVTLVTFDQPVALSTLRPVETGLVHSYRGFEIVNGDGSFVTITGASVAGNVVTLARAAAPTGAWAVRNGLQNVDTGTTTVTNDMPRTWVIGTTNIGTTADGTLIENCSITQEIAA